jgi:hypothetical protein
MFVIIGCGGGGGDDVKEMVEINQDNVYKKVIEPYVTATIFSADELYNKNIINPNLKRYYKFYAIELNGDGIHECPSSGYIEVLNNETKAIYHNCSDGYAIVNGTAEYNGKELKLYNFSYKTTEESFTVKKYIALENDTKNYYSITGVFIYPDYKLEFDNYVVDIQLAEDNTTFYTKTNGFIKKDKWIKVKTIKTLESNKNRKATYESDEDNSTTLFSCPYDGSVEFYGKNSKAKLVFYDDFGVDLYVNEQLVKHYENCILLGYDKNN